MPSLKPGSTLWNHVFGIGNSDKKKMSGFHSKAKIINANPEALVPHIKRRFAPPVAGAGFYLCGWNYYEGKETPVKWSTMFPDNWDERKVVDAVQQAIKYWNENGDKGGPNKDRLEGLMRKYRASWVGQASVDDYVYMIGGKSSGGDATTAFPLMGANANFPEVQCADAARLNEDVTDDS